MNVLLDTHTFLWFVQNDTRLSQTARNIIEDAQTEAYLSIATPWEIAIKIGTGKLRLAANFDAWFPKLLVDNDIILLPIQFPHLSRLTNLPLHHRDPFDRLLIAQAQAESLTLISADAAFDAYPITRLW